MRVISLDALPHRSVDSYDNSGLSIAAFGLCAEAHLVSVRLRQGGVIARHPAAGRQLLVVLVGDAIVSGGANGDPVEIGPGQAAVWEPHEPHETRSATGLSALVVEGEIDLVDG